ncbi:MAG: RNase adapter RapZ [Rhodospirillales bacterium]
MTDQAISTSSSARNKNGGPDNTPDERTRVLLVTGMSGAGKTSALKALEDIGYEAVDNMPLSLIGSLVAPSRRTTGQSVSIGAMAIGVDIRTRDFGVEPLIREMDNLASENSIQVSVLFMDCDDGELIRRYDVTRHRHPLAQDRPVRDGIHQERQMVSPLRERADLILDTTGIGPGELKRILSGHFGLKNKLELSIFVVSFSFRNGLPRDADLVFDVRFLANPHYDPGLKDLTGLDSAVGDFISADDGFAGFFDGLTGFLWPLLPRYVAEGKSYLAVAVGCTGGRHRSVFVAEKLAGWLNTKGQKVQIRHRDLDVAKK